MDIITVTQLPVLRCATAVGKVYKPFVNYTLCLSLLARVRSKVAYMDFTDT